MAPNCSFTHCRYSVKHEEDADSDKGFAVENWRECIYVEYSHETESTEDPERTCNYDWHSVLGKTVTKGCIG
jgi:hypothetical protein